MKLIKITILAVVMLICSCAKSNNTNQNKDTVAIIEASNNKASLRVGEVLKENSWTISPDVNPDIWWVEVKEDENVKATFITDLDSISFNLKSNESKDFIVLLNEKDTAYTRLKAISKAVSFSEDYIKRHKGKYTVDNPETHELVNIMVALTESGRIDSNMVNMKTMYHKDVMNHFNKFSNHPVIDTFNQHIKGVFDNDSYWYYYNIRMNSNMYSFNNRNKIINKSPYTRLGFDKVNHLEPLIPMINDFVKTSNYRAFYKEHKTYQDSLIKEYYRLVDIDKMWKWVEARFSNSYDSYKIYISPLIGGAHATQRFKDEGFKETVMFINAPIFDKNYSEKSKEADLTRTVFTEIDHNYVNPASNKFSEINEIMQPLECWNKGAQGYGNGYATFNEYMTWAVFTLYLYDNFDTKIFNKKNKEAADFMQNGRGFIRFHSFNDFVLDWYKENQNRSFLELYPVVIDWIKKQDCSAVNHE